MSQLHPIPELRELGQIPVPEEYQGADRARLRDYLTGFQMAWEIALRHQAGLDVNRPRP